MGKLNVKKSTQIKREFDYMGGLVEIEVKGDFTTEALDKLKNTGKVDVKDVDLRKVSEMVCLMVLSWNLEDDAGDIPLDTESVYKRVPLFLLYTVAKEAQEALTSGGLTKKIGS